MTPPLSHSLFFHQPAAVPPFFGLVGDAQQCFAYASAAPLSARGPVRGLARGQSRVRSGALHCQGLGMRTGIVLCTERESQVALIKILIET